MIYVMSDKIDDIVLPILKNIQSDISDLKESVVRIDMRLKHSSAT